MTLFLAVQRRYIASTAQEMADALPPTGPDAGAGGPAARDAGHQDRNEPDWVPLVQGHYNAARRADRAVHASVFVVTARGLMVLAAAGSLALLAAAFAFQAMGWQPCQMCLWQRWPHAAAVAVGGLALLAAGPATAVLGALAALSTAGIAGFHSGVERGWWDGPSSCTGQGLSSLSGAALLPGADGPGVVLCDQFTPFLLGLSMANVNMLASLALAALWGFAAFRAARD